jgi:hypothetical protein
VASKVPHLQVLGGAERVNLGLLQTKCVTFPGVQFEGSETNGVVLLISVPRGHTPRGIDGFLDASALNARRITFDFMARTLTCEH